jgi:PAS domain-containing protein
MNKISYNIKKLFFWMNMKNLSLPQFYASAFSQMNDLVYLLDKDGFLVDCNHNFLHFLGLDNSKTPVRGF